MKVLSPISFTFILLTAIHTEVVGFSPLPPSTMMQQGKTLGQRCEHMNRKVFVFSSMRSDTEHRKRSQQQQPMMASGITKKKEEVLSRAKADYLRKKQLADEAFESAAKMAVETIHDQVDSFKSGNYETTYDSNVESVLHSAKDKWRHDMVKAKKEYHAVMKSVKQQEQNQEQTEHRLSNVSSNSTVRP